MKRLLILSPLALAACSTPRPVLVLPPADLATCADEPPAPDLPAKDGTEATRDKRDLLMRDGYLNLRTAYGDCKSKVMGLAKWRESTSKP